MKRLIMTAAALGSLAIGAQAQEVTAPNKTFSFTSSSTVMGKPIKGAPYSADEITESVQVLADGTKISHQNQVSVYRDGEGRVRRDSPDQITIFDPVQNVSYSLNPKTMIATKTSMGSVAAKGVYFYAGSSSSSISSNGITTTTSNSMPAGAYELQVKAKADLDKMMAEAAAQHGAMVVNGSAASDEQAYTVKMQLDQVKAKLAASGRAMPVTETLGQRMIEGVTAEGTRSTTTLEVGAIGNDRPIHVVSERWYSPDLQTPVMTKLTDPRTGEETFKLTNVHRGEPGADLFLLPPGYQLANQLTLTPLPAKKEE